MSGRRVALADRLWGAIARGEHPLPTESRRILMAVLLSSFVLRLGLGWLLPNINHADEVYQVAEQANRVAHGYGIVPWEFRTASRTAILPTVVEPIFALDVGARGHRFLESAFFCLLSLIPICVAFQWAGRISGLAGAVVAGAVMATWFELLYFAPKATADAVAGYFLIGGVYLCRPGAQARAVFAGGLSLALTLALRIQVAPAVSVAVAMALLVPGRGRTLALVAGGLVGLGIAGAIEWRWWGVPFQGQVGYLLTEFTHHSSRFFAQQPVTFYVKQYVLMYGAALPVVLFLLWRGALLAPVAAVAAVAVLVPFHFVGHKEYRFMIAALPLLVLLMGLAAAVLVNALEASGARRAAGWTIAGWAVGMIAVSLGDTYRPLWTTHGNHVLAFESVGRDPAACGVALVGIRWWQTPGYSGLGAEIPIYEMRGEVDDDRLRDASNYILEAPKAPPPPPPYEAVREFTRPVQYLYRRPGGCSPLPAAAVVTPPGIPGID